MSQGPLEHDERPQVYFQGRGSPQLRIPSRIPPHRWHKIPDLAKYECKSATNCDKVDNLIINFWPLVSQVIFGSFHTDLPPTFSTKSPNDTTAPVTGPGRGGKRQDANNDKGGGNKKRKGETTRLVNWWNTFFPMAKFACSQMKGELNFTGKQVDQCLQWNTKCKCFIQAGAKWNKISPTDQIGPFSLSAKRTKSRMSRKSSFLASTKAQSNNRASSKCWWPAKLFDVLLSCSPKKMLRSWESSLLL